MAFHVVILSGDGIGPEVCREAIRNLQALNYFYNCEFEIEERPIGGTAIRMTGTPLPETTVQACLESDAVLVGPVGGPEFQTLSAPQDPRDCILRLQRILGAFANLQPAVCFKAVADNSPLQESRIKGMDVLVVRELYRPTRNLCGQKPARYSVEDIERVAHVAFKQARSRRKRLTCIDPANVLDSCRIWRNTMTKVSWIYPEVELEHMDADTCAISLVANPRYFDVIATPDFFGDLFTGEVAAIAGFPGMLASVTLASKVHLYEPLVGPASEIGGRDIANPLGAIAATAHLLRHSVGMDAEACDLEAAIRQVVESGCRTADLAQSGDGRVVGTTEMGLLVEQAFAEMLDRRFAYHAV